MINQKVQLTDGEINIFPNPNLIGVDFDNIIANITSNTSPYTAECDSAILFVSGDTGGTLQVEGKDFNYCKIGTGHATCVYIKKGQQVRMGNKSNRMIICGLKYI